MKGIFFKPDIIQAIVEGRKTQTRRAIKPQPACHCGGNNWKGQVIDWIGYKHEGKTGFFCHKCSSGLQKIDEWSSHGILPRYHAGETVYIKEAHYRYGWWVKNGISKTGRQKWRFKFAPSLESDHIGGEDFRYYENPPSDIKPNTYHGEGWYKRSPLFMPEWAARHFITITGVRAERLQEITEEDVFLEGFRTSPGMTSNGSVGLMSAVACFRELWNSINPKYPWESNPWVFAYEFQLLHHNWRMT